MTCPSRWSVIVVAGLLAVYAAAIGLDDDPFFDSEVSDRPGVQALVDELADLPFVAIPSTDQATSGAPGFEAYRALRSIATTHELEAMLWHPSQTARIHAIHAIVTGRTPFDPTAVLARWDEAGLRSALRWLTIDELIALRDRWLRTGAINLEKYETLVEMYMWLAPIGEGAVMNCWAPEDPWRVRGIRQRIAEMWSLADAAAICWSPNPDP